MSDQKTVLVTGGSGYIGGWCVIGLLQQGYTVRTTVRDLTREAGVRAALGTIVDPADRLSFYAANLTSDAGWEAATEGCDYVLHVASPLGVPPPKDPDDLIIPARDGALRALNAAIKAGVKRVVMTSSVAATTPPIGSPDGTIDEATWTDSDDVRHGAYSRSKTIAERAARDLIASAGGATTFATVNPGMVLGPVFGADFSDSVQIVQRMLTGKMPGLPRLGFTVVDVRDVADLHIRAMIDPAAAGGRFIAANEFAWMADIAAVLRAKLGDRAAKVPTRNAPDVLIRLVSLFDRDLSSVTLYLGRRQVFSSAKAQSVLGWRPRPMADTVLDCANSLIEKGLV